MARLSGTRLEPTLEAVAINKTDLKVRTVVQFLKASLYTRLVPLVINAIVSHTTHRQNGALSYTLPSTILLRAQITART